MIKKVSKDNKGFTLTEVMIGIMILTVAIVAASNMLVTLIRSNEVNLTSMQAHYFAVEGLEAVRSIRDTNWLHNQDWEVGNGTGNWKYTLTGDFQVVLKSEGWSDFTSSSLSVNDLFVSYFPWDHLDSDELIIKCGDEFSKVYFGDCSGSGFSENTQFSRTINIKGYDCDPDVVIGCDPDNSIEVTSTVSWNIGADDRELSLSTVLTDWKGGAF